MITVKVYGLTPQGDDRTVGTIGWDGKALVLDPPDSRLLKNIASSPAWPAMADAPVTAKDDPEAFLKALQDQYRSAYLRAGPPEEAVEAAAKSVRRVPPSPFRGRKSLVYFAKGEGQPCRQGETAARSRCIPASDEGGKQPGGGNAGKPKGAATSFPTDVQGLTELLRKAERYYERQVNILRNTDPDDSIHSKVEADVTKAARLSQELKARLRQAKKGGEGGGNTPKKTLKERARAARDRFNKIKEKVTEGGRKAADKAGYAVIRTKHFFQELAEKVLGKATAEEAAKVYEVVQDSFNEVMLGEDYDIPDDPSNLGLDIALNLIPDTVAWLYRWGRKKFTGVDPRDVKYPAKALKEGVDLKAVAKLITKYIDDLVEKGFDVEPLDEAGVLELLERNWAKHKGDSPQHGEKALSYRVKMKEGKDTSGRRYCWDENTGNRVPCSPGRGDSVQQAAAGPQAPAAQPQQPQQPRPKQSRRDARRAARAIAKKRVQQRKAQTRAVKEMLDKVSVGSIKKAVASAKQAVDAAMQKTRNAQAAAKAGALKMVDWAAKEFNLDPGDVDRIKKRLGDYNEKETEELGKKGEYGPQPGPGKIGSVLRVLKTVAPEMTSQIVRRLRVASGGGDPRERPASDKPTLARRVLGPKVHRAVMQALGQQHVDTPPTPEQTARLQQKLQEEWDRMQREGGQKALSWLANDRGGALVPPPARGKFATPFRNRKGITRRSLEAEQFGKLLAGVKAIRRSAKNPNYCYDDELKKRVPCDKKPTGEGVNTGEPQKEEQPVKKPEYLEDEDVRQAQAGVDQALERVNRARQTEGIADDEYAEQAAEFAERQYAEAVEIARRKREAENFTGVDEEGRYWHNGVRQPESVPSRSPDEIDGDIAQAERDLDLYRRLAEGAAQPARRAFQDNVERTERELEELRRERADAAESQDSREPTPEEYRDFMESLNPGDGTLLFTAAELVDRGEMTDEQFVDYVSRKAHLNRRMVAEFLRVHQEANRDDAPPPDREPTPEEVRRVHNPESGRASAEQAILDAGLGDAVEDGVRLTAEQIEQASDLVHQAWMRREASLPGGGRSSRRHLMVPYDQLSEEDKEKDRAFVREVVASMRPKDYWGSKQQPFWRPGPNPTVDTVVIRQGEDGPEVLLIRRKEGGLSEDTKKQIERAVTSSPFPVVLTGVNTEDVLSQFSGATNLDLSEYNAAGTRQAILNASDAAKENGAVVAVKRPKDVEAMQKLARLVKNEAEDGVRFVVYSADDSASGLLAANRDLQGRSMVIRTKKQEAAEAGKWALPGGFIDTDAKRGEPFKEGKETPQDAALRELAEESGLDLAAVKERLKTVGKFDSRGRDPRDNAEAWAVSDAFAVELPPEMADAYVEGRDDADRAEWVPVSKLGERDIAFDHRDILKQAGYEAPAKAEETKPAPKPKVKPSPLKGRKKPAKKPSPKKKA